jgi:hypothetical protein
MKKNSMSNTYLKKYLFSKQLINYSKIDQTLNSTEKTSLTIEPSNFSSEMNVELLKSESYLDRQKEVSESRKIDVNRILSFQE